MNTMKTFFRSKRFFFTMISIVYFGVGLFVFNIEPIPLATGITTLLAPYLVVETIKKSV